MFETEETTTTEPYLLEIETITTKLETTNE